MIFDILINTISSVVNTLLLPLEAINITVDFISTFTPIMDFFKVIAYVLPWNNIMPLIMIIISTFVLRIVISLLKTIWGILPIV